METRIIGTSPQIRSLLEFIARAAPSEKNILLLGETGTGKDLAARHIHELSHRRERPFVALNCSTIPEGLFEAELFGYRKGAFTGADKDKPGLFEIARDGTAFLDEVGELPLALQAKLLRIIDKRELRPIGDTRTRKVGTRFIFATNRDLIKEVGAGRFRMDLYYRISVVQFRVPSLRERKEDIPILAAHILRKDAEATGRVRVLSEDALDILTRYDFPGNVRELENILERSALLAEATTIRVEDLDIERRRAHPLRRISAPPDADEVRKALEKCRWNKSMAARRLMTSRRHLYRLIKKYGLADRDCGQA